MTTKEKILFEALKQFSINGYDAVSTRDISRSLGLSDSVIYKHFKSKKDIFNSIILLSKETFIEQLKNVDLKNIKWDDLENVCLNMFLFQTKNEIIVMFRRLLILEQFKNEEMYELYREFFIDLEVDNTTNIFKSLQEDGWVKKEFNPHVLAMELYAPFFMYHTSKENDDQRLYEELKLHIKYLRENVRVNRG